MNIDEAQRRVEALPAMSTLATELLALANCNDPDLSEIRRNLERDPAIAARLLRIANSPFYGLSGRISSVKDACVVLGTRTVCCVVTTSVAMEQFPATGGNYLDRSILWRHSMATAAAAKICAGLACLPAEVAFTTAVLHDIGRLALDAHFPLEYGRALRHCAEPERAAPAVEAEVLGFDHAALGACLARCWRLPAEIIDAIEKHHDATASEPLSALLQVADVVAHRVTGLSETPAGEQQPTILLAELPQDAIRVLGIDQTDIEAAIQPIQTIYEGLCAVI